MAALEGKAGQFTHVQIRLGRRLNPGRYVLNLLVELYFWHSRHSFKRGPMRYVVPSPIPF
jgi:hypothetical protein